MKKILRPIKNLKKILRPIKNRFLSMIQFNLYYETIPKNPMHDDIFIVEYPKSGITWLSFILGNIELELENIDEVITYYNYHKYIIDIHRTRSASINRKLRRTFIKSHSTSNPFYHFVIYLIRNPFDVMVSFYNYRLDLGDDMDFQTFVRHPELGIQAWVEHVDGWQNKQADDQKIHYLRYEDLLKNSEESIRNIYDNLGVNVDQKIIRNAIEKSSLQNMRQSEDIYMQNNKNYNMSFVGKKNKKSKEELLTKDVKKYIYNIAQKQLQQYYPEIEKRMKNEI
jgi:hypothetical protein